MTDATPKAAVTPTWISELSKEELREQIAMLHTETVAAGLLLASSNEMLAGYRVEVERLRETVDKLLDLPWLTDACDLDQETGWCLRHDAPSPCPVAAARALKQNDVTPTPITGEPHP
jgi:hypothetical protein